MTEHIASFAGPDTSQISRSLAADPPPKYDQLLRAVRTLQGFAGIGSRDEDCSVHDGEERGRARSKVL